MTVARLWLGLAGVFSSGIALVLQTDKTPANQPAASFWLAGMALFAVAAIWPRWAGKGENLAGSGLRARVWQVRWEILAVAGILALAVALRFINLNEIPPEVHNDEARIGSEARRMLSDPRVSWFGFGWMSFPHLSFLIAGAFMPLLGQDLFALRLVSFGLGTASVLLAYLLFRLLFGPRVALLSAFLLAVSFWHIHYSRDGLNNIHASFVGLLVLYFTARAVKWGQAGDYVFLGFAAGLSFEQYWAARLVPVLAGVFILSRLIADRGFLRRHWRGALIAMVGLAIFMAPFIPHFARDPGMLVGRNDVLVLKKLEHARSGYGTADPWQVLGIQAVRSLESFNLRGETSLQFGRRAPLLDYWTASLLFLGLAYGTYALRRPEYLLTALWFWATLVLGGMITIDALFSPRVVGIIPVVFLFPALVLDRSWRAVEVIGGRVGRWVAPVLVVAFLALSLSANYDIYFNQFVVKEQPAGFHTVLGRYLGSLPAGTRAFVTAPDGAATRHETVRFLAGGTRAEDVPLSTPLPAVGEAATYVAFAVAPEMGARLEAAKRAYPGGVEQEHRDGRGRPLFRSYLVERPGGGTPSPALAAPASSPATAAGVAAPSNVPVSTPPPAAAPVPAGDADLILGDSGPGALREPRGLAVDRAGNVYVADRDQFRVVKYDSAGKFVRAWGRKGEGDSDFLEPVDVAVDGQGHVAVLDAGNGWIKRFSPDGALLGKLGGPPSGLYHPIGLGFDGSGALYVADTGGGRIVRFDGTGGQPIPLGQRGKSPGQLDQPTDVAVDASGNLYVVDVANRRVSAFDPTFKLLAEWPFGDANAFHAPHLDVSADGIVYVSDPERGRALRFSLRAGSLDDVGLRGGWRPVGLALDSSGHLFVGDVAGNRVLRFRISP